MVETRSAAKGARQQQEGPQDSLRDPLQDPLQFKGQGAASRSPNTLEVAAEGTSGSGGSLPFGGQIQAAFGRHDVSGATAHTGAQAQGANATLGSKAYASGNDIAFGGTPDLHTAAHEAAHLVQQGGGVQLKGGVGEAGDAYERHADRVADAVVRGDSAESILDQGPGGGAGALQFSGRAVQFGGKPKKDEGEKAKGEDYANNVQKLVDDISALLNSEGAFADAAIDAALSTINTNRPRCTAASGDVTGPDANQAAYGSFKSDLMASLGTMSWLPDETDKGSFVKGVRGVVAAADAVLATLAATAVDPRVATVIRDGGDKGAQAAMAALDTALGQLQAALRARLKAYLSAMYDRKFSSPAKKDDKDRPPGPGGGGAAVPVK